MKRYVKEMINDFKFSAKLERENERCAIYNKQLDKILRVYERGLITSKEAVKEAFILEV